MDKIELKASGMINDSIPTHIIWAWDHSWTVVKLKLLHWLKVACDIIAAVVGDC